MSLNTDKTVKFFLVTGLLIILVQGFVQLPEVQDYIFPYEPLNSFLRSAKQESLIIEQALISSKARVAYLQWFLAHRNPVPTVSWKRMASFPLSESIRRWSPQFVLNVNFYLAKKDKVKAERKMKYLEALINKIDLQLNDNVPKENTHHSIKNSSALNHLKLEWELKHKMLSYSRDLNELDSQLTALGNNTQLN
jgi:hypothetical protein